MAIKSKRLSKAGFTLESAADRTGMLYVSILQFRAESLPEFGPETELKTHSISLQCAPQPPWRYVNQLHTEPVTFSCYANWMRGKFT